MTDAPRERSASVGDPYPSTATTKKPRIRVLGTHTPLLRSGPSRATDTNSACAAGGEECHEEGPPAESCSARPRETKGGPTQCCTPDWISVASVSTSTCSTVTAGRSSAVHQRRTPTVFVV